MTEQDKLRRTIERIRCVPSRQILTSPTASTAAVTVWESDLAEIIAAAEQSLTFRRLPLPEELDGRALVAMWDASQSDLGITKWTAMRSAYKALYEHLTKPKTVKNYRLTGIDAADPRDFVDLGHAIEVAARAVVEGHKVCIVEIEVPA